MKILAYASISSFCLFLSIHCWAKATHLNIQTPELNPLEVKSWNQNPAELDIERLNAVDPLDQTRHLHPDSIIHVRGTPYDFDWTQADNPKQAFADKNSGQFALAVSPCGNPAGWGTHFRRTSAGVGAFFRPQAPSTVRFSAFTKYHFNYIDHSLGTPAHSSGFVGLYVASTNLDGKDGRIEMDKRNELWRDSTSGFSRHQDDQEGRLNFDQSTAFMQMTPDRIYQMWVWGSIAAQCRSLFIPLPPFLLASDASAQMEVNVPFMVFEEGL